MANESSKGPSRSQADKERSRQQSRPVDGRNVTGRQASGGNRPPRGTGGAGAGRARQGTAGRNGNGRAPAPAGPAPARRTPGGRPPRPGTARPGTRRSTASLLTWGTVALVLIIVVVLVIVKVTGSTSSTSGPPWEPVSASIVAQVTDVPASVFNEVGVNSTVAAVTPPITVKNQAPLKFPGTTLPGIFYFGAEYCPYCAAERWAIIASMSRFGTFKNLGAMVSSSTDVYPNTQTFTFARASYTSKYFVFKTDEYLSDQVPSSGVGYTVLHQPTPFESKLISKYDSATYFGGSESNYPAFPFLNFGNKVLQLSANYDPGILAGLSRSDIASGLSNPKNPITQAIIATANYLSAATCMADGQQPASVCTSKGVTEAASKITASSS